jgi:hypothetical protein
MAPGIVILLGRSIWTRDAGSWRRESFDAGLGGAAEAFARMRAILSADPPRKWTLIFEPEALGHQVVETPKVSRRVFASLAKVRSEFPVVESETLGWGIEVPEPTQGGVFSTLLHAELTPGLSILHDACAPSSSRLEAAWPAYTAAVACVQSSSPASRARFLVILTHDFIAVATCIAGKRSFKSWAGPMAERDWKAFSNLIGDSDPRPAGSMGDPGLRRGGIAVIAEGEPVKLCPLWGEIHASGRVAAVFNMDALATAAARIPRKHPANLVESFPIPRNLDRYLAFTVSVAIVAVFVLGVLVIGGRKKLGGETSACAERSAAFNRRLEALTRNQDEMNRLSSEVPSDLRPERISVHDALVGLAAAIPDTITLTSLAIGKDDVFEMEAIVVGPGFDPDAFRRAFGKSGFSVAETNGWVFDASAGRLAIHGRLASPRT